MRKLKPYLGTDGYLQVQYRMENHKQHHNRVHVIIAHCFIPNPNNYKYINHIDSNKTNNNIDNLEWCTNCLLYTSPSPRDRSLSRMPSSA